MLVEVEALRGATLIEAPQPTQAAARLILPLAVARQTHLAIRAVRPSTPWEGLDSAFNPDGAPSIVAEVVRPGMTIFADELMRLTISRYSAEATGVPHR
jgi:hypothetical protein